MAINQSQAQSFEKHTENNVTVENKKPPLHCVTKASNIENEEHKTHKVFCYECQFLPQCSEGKSAKESDMTTCVFYLGGNKW